MNKIKLIVHFYISNYNKQGICYYAVKVTSTTTGESTEFRIARTSNFLRDACVYGIGFKWDEIYEIEEYMGHRDWRRNFGSLFEYCHGEDMAKVIREKFNWQKGEIK